MLGLFASIIIIYIQNTINYKIQLSKEIIPYLKQINDDLFEIKYKTEEALGYMIMDYPRNYYELKKLLYSINKNACTLNDMEYIDKKSKYYVKDIYERITELCKEVSPIFEYYDKCNKEEKRYLFLQLSKILKSFNYKYINQQTFYLANRIDFEQYISRKGMEKNKKEFIKANSKMTKAEYLSEIKEENKVKYKALKRDFELYDKNRIKKKP